jgi:hypothetical protein
MQCCTHLSAKLGNRLYGGTLAEARRPLEGSVTTLVGVEEVDDVTGVAPATEGRDGDSGADTLWTGANTRVHQASIGQSQTSSR